jgi:hypothetical protein
MLFASSTQHDATVDDLIAAGWTRMSSGKWTHQMFTMNGRRRLFSEASALTLHAVSQPAQTTAKGDPDGEAS